ncbi:hypothetical protein GF360_00645 [candidate division WWE3 bacterium]|nr:hypothetical protein [candidate division WWE3 bacterium]
MNFSNRKVLYINLSDKTFNVKTYPDLHAYLGGLALGLKLLQMHADEDPLIFSIGPLNGLFPYVSKTCVLTGSNLDLATESNSIINPGRKGLTELYLGGSLSSRLRFIGLDAVVILGKSKTPVFTEITSGAVNFYDSFEEFSGKSLPGRSSLLSFKEHLLLDDYFHTKDHLLSFLFAKRNLGGLLINADSSFDIEGISRYGKLYLKLFNEAQKLKISPADNPSCVGCPMGCDKSQVGETSGNVLVHSLVACTYAEEIYSDPGVVFSCLNALGYVYTHEELENIPNLVKSLMEDLENL